jgi:hypothetical protein
MIVEQMNNAAKMMWMAVAADKGDNDGSSPAG